MSTLCSIRPWVVCVNAEVVRRIAPGSEAGRVAGMFGLADGRAECLYDGLRLEIRPGQIVAAVGPSGAGKSVLLREAARQVPGAIPLAAARLARSDRPAVEHLRGGALAGRLELLSRCGLADAAALVTPACCLSGGQRHRLALAASIHRARKGRPRLVIADELASGLDPATAAVLCRQLRRIVSRSPIALLAATPNVDLLAELRPDVTVTKPLAGPAEVTSGRPRRQRRFRPERWPIRRGTIADYRAVAAFHYLAGPPAAHKRVWTVRTPARLARGGVGPIAAVLVVSPPVMNVRGRNLATDGRYAGSDRLAATDLLNREVECISRVVVHPVFRGCGLAVRLVRHALATADTPLLEALAAMGAVHPFFERAGMKAWKLPLDVHAARLLSAIEAVGLEETDLADPRRIHTLLGGADSPRAEFLRREMDVYCTAAIDDRRRDRLADPVAEACRAATRRYVYYLARTGKGGAR